MAILHLILICGDGCGTVALFRVSLYGLQDPLALANLEQVGPLLLLHRDGSILSKFDFVAMRAYDQEFVVNEVNLK